MLRCPARDRPIALPITLAGALLLTLLGGRALISLVLWAHPSLRSTYYDLGFGGSYPHRSYVSFPLSSPDPVWLQWDPSCGGGYLFLDVNGPAVTQNSPAILNSDGELVWMSDQFDTTMNSRLQRYRNETFLTFWAGEKAQSSGHGAYHLLNRNYELVHSVRAHGVGLSGDLHEFRITPSDTALIAVYNVTQADLSSLGGLHTTDGWIMDSLFQEIDIATGELLFQWRASDHFDVSSTEVANMFAGLHVNYPLDFFHINSVEKDDLGNYLISSRHLHSVIYINGTDGGVAWVLGGTLNDFTSDFDFHWQHDARWVSREAKTISLFDNGMAWPQISAPYSRGLLIRADSDNFTATMISSFTSLGLARSSSQGSVQVVSTDDAQHVLIGWGSSAIITESSLEGDVLCEMHFGASSLHFWERVKSYRAFKAPANDWDTAQPVAWSPSLQIKGGRCFVSWNGAATVVSWELQGQRRGDQGVEDFETIDIKARRHFEESFKLLSAARDGAPYVNIRVAALDAHDRVLDYSNISSMPAEEPWPWSWSLFLVAVLLCAAMTIGRKILQAKWP